MDGLYAGELYPSEAVTHTHTHTHTHRVPCAPRSLLATGAPSRLCSLHWLCGEGSEDGQARACAGQAPASGWPPCFSRVPRTLSPPCSVERTLKKELWRWWEGGKATPQLWKLPACEGAEWLSHLLRVTQPHLTPRPKHLTWPYAASTGKPPKSQKVLAPRLAEGNDTGQAMVAPPHLVLDAEPTHLASDMKKYGIRTGDPEL